jgi:hypothetical protein
MKYRDMLGFPKKPKKKVEKKVSPTPTAPPVTELLKNEFGPLNEWSEQDTGTKRWSGSGLTEFEQQGGKDNVNEGPAYEYAKISKKIEKLKDELGKAVLEFSYSLRKKGLDDNADDLLELYSKTGITFGLRFKKFLRKLM